VKYCQTRKPNKKFLVPEIRDELKKKYNSGQKKEKGEKKREKNFESFLK